MQRFKILLKIIDGVSSVVYKSVKIILFKK